MRILYITQYFPPESGATQTRAHEMAGNFVRLGHSVTVLTEFPNHPSGIIPPHYRGKLIERTIFDGIDVIRVWVVTKPEKNFISRMLFYLSFMVNAFLAGLFIARGKFDLVYASSPPLFVGGTALALSWIRRSPLVFEVRDLWPESAIALGELSNKIVVKLATWLELQCYRKARKIIVVTQGIRNHLEQRGVSGEKIVVIPNGANVELFQFDPISRAKIRRSLSLDNKTVLIYAGIHGIAQGLETVVEAARILSDDPSYIFLFIGEGPKKSEIQYLSNRYSLSNIYFLNEQPREIIPKYLSAADIALVPLRNVDLFKSAIPSKMFDAWACERPVITSVDGEARDIVTRANGGIFFPPEDPIALATAIKQINNYEDTRIEMGKNGRRFTAQNYSRQVLAEQLSNILVNLL